MKLNVKKTSIKLLEDSGEVFLEKGLLIEGDGLCAIYADGSFDFVCSDRHELNYILVAKSLNIKELGEERLCSQCESPMQEGFYFESDRTQYCSETCLTTVISWAEYLKIHDNGNGDAYWTDWYEC